MEHLTNYFVQALLSKTKNEQYIINSIKEVMNS